MKQLEQLYEQLQPRVFAFFYVKTANKSVAEDLTHDTFYETMKNYQSFNGESTITTWIFGIANNLLKKYYRKNMYAKNLTEKITADQQKGELIEEQYILKEMTNSLLKKINQLDDLTKEIVLLRIYGELSHKEISSLVNKSENYVRVHFHRAKLQLQKELGAEND